MRTIAPTASAVLAGQEVPLVVLVEMLLTLPIRMASTPYNVVYGGQTYVGLGQFGSVEEIDDSPGEYKSVQFALTGVQNDMLTIALNEDIRNKAVYVRNATLDPTTHAVLDAPLAWSGTLDQMPIQFGKETSQITVTAEHRGATFARVKALRYNDVDQQRLYPGDTSLRFVTSQANHQDVWPAAAFFRK
jgi:hypothetical protein